MCLPAVPPSDLRAVTKTQGGRANQSRRASVSRNGTGEILAGRGAFQAPEGQSHNGTSGPRKSEWMFQVRWPTNSPRDRLNSWMKDSVNHHGVWMTCLLIASESLPLYFDPFGRKLFARLVGHYWESCTAIRPEALACSRNPGQQREHSWIQHCGPADASGTSAYS